MTYENFEHLINLYKSKKPFQIFTIRLHNGERYEVDDPSGLAYKEGLAVLISPGPVPVWFDHESVSEIIHAPAVDADK